MNASPDVLLLSGPPVGAGIWRVAAPRVEERLGVRATASNVLEWGGTWQEAAERLTASLRARPRVVVAHGLAVPAAIAAAAEVELPLLVLCNGPLTRLDPVHRALAMLASAPGGARALAATLLRPAAFTAVLASSLALRRAVVNPYAMDRDIVAALAGPLVADAAGRVAVARWWGSLRAPWPRVDDVRGRVVLAWGDEDVLHPIADVAAVQSRCPDTVRVDMHGARWMWPEERPWALVDALEREWPGR
jgi:hypothetical protein